MLKAIISFLSTILIIYILNTSWLVNGKRIPPLGKFLDPMHGFWQNAEPENFTGQKELNLKGLHDAVTIVYDSLLIPHIFANNDDDLYLAQGYITATHRLWQMEFQTHASAGRLASILGVGPDSAILNYDRSQRRLGLVFAAQNALDSIASDPTSKRILEKYTDGVNQYIQSLSYEDLPLEYKLMDYKPEEWTQLKCGLLLKSMNQTLNMGDKDMQMTNALHLFGKEMVDILYPDRESNSDPIVDNPGGWKFDPIKFDSIPLALPDEAISISGLETPDPTIGSNNWAVSGSKTKSGSPILCNDPHLNTTLPSIWFAAQLNAPGVNTMGVTLPGVPLVIIGFNDSIAWGITNAQRDVVDWYKITYQDKSRSKYLLDDKWKDTQKQVEEIHVRDGAIFYDTVIYTTWGPVTYDETFRGQNENSNYAFRWISHDPSNEFMAFYQLNRAKNHSDYMKALDHFAAPAQNIAFASVSGDIAIRIQGKYPVRRKDEGKYVLDGSKSANGWQAFIPFDQNVMSKNPERGFVSSANQYPVDETYPYYVTATSYEAYRNRRINQVLRDASNITVKDMMKLQNDNLNLKAKEALPVFLSALDSTSFKLKENEAYQILKSWDYVNNVDSEGATYFEAWWNTVMSLTWDEMNNSTTSLSRPTSFNTVKFIQEKPDFSFFDIQQTPEKETAKEIIIKSFQLAVQDVQKWKEDKHEPARWGDYKDTFIQHLARLEPFSVHVEHGGNNSCVNASTRTHGPSWRMIVSLHKSGVNAMATYPGGQSGNPGSAHYTDLLQAWSHGEYYKLHFLKNPKQDATKMFFSTQLKPAAQ